MLLIHFIINIKYAVINSNLHLTIMVTMIPLILIIVMYIIFIICNKSKGIIKDTGLCKIILFSIGIIFYFISNIFSTYTTYFQYSIYFFFKHAGTSLIIAVFLLMIVLNYELGIGQKRNEYNNGILKFDMGKEDNEYVSEPNICVTNNDIQNTIKSALMEDKENEQKEDQTKTTTGIYSPVADNNRKSINLKRIISDINFRKDNSLGENNGNSFKKIKRLSSRIIEIILLSHIYIITLIVFIIIKKEGEKVIYQDLNGMWYHYYSLEKENLIFNSFELTILIYIFVKSNHINEFECIFRYIKKIFYSVIIGATLGPLVNVIYIFKSYSIHLIK